MARLRGTGSSVGVRSRARRFHADTRDRERRRQKPLEFPEFDTADVIRKRSQRYCVHAVCRRRRGQLHGGGHFARVAADHRFGSVVFVRQFLQTRYYDTVNHEHNPLPLSAYLRRQPDEEHPGR